MTIDITDVVRKAAGAKDLNKILEGDEWESVIKSWTEEQQEIWKPAQIKGWDGSPAYPSDVYVWPIPRIYYKMDPYECRNLDDPERAEIAFYGSDYDRGDHDTYWFPALYLIDHDRWRSEEEAKVEPYLAARLEAKQKEKEEKAAKALADRRAEYERLRAEFEEV